MPIAPKLIVAQEQAETNPRATLPTQVVETSKVGNKIVQATLSNCNGLKPKDVKWFKRYVFPSNRLSLISGEIGTQKTFFLCTAAVACMKGRWPDGEQCDQGDVLFLSDDDEIEDNILPKILAAGGTGAQLHKLSLKENGESTDIDLVKYKELIKRVLEAHSNIRLILLDPADAFFPGMDGKENVQTRTALRFLRSIAVELEITIIMAGHFNKGEKSAAVDKAMGSKAWVSVPRATWQIHFDTEDTNPDKTVRRRLMVPIRVSSALEQPPTLCFTVTKREPEFLCGRVLFLPYEHHVEANDLTAPQPQELGKKWHLAKPIINICFAAHGGTHCPVAEIKSALSAAGIQYNKNSLYDWRTKYGAVSQTIDKRVCWVLQETSSSSSNPIGYIDITSRVTTTTTTKESKTPDPTNGHYLQPNRVTTTTTNGRIATLARRYEQDLKS